MLTALTLWSLTTIFGTLFLGLPILHFITRDR